MTDQEDTPRTEAAKIRIKDSDHYVVHITLARELERELTKLREEVQRLRGEIEKTWDEARDGHWSSGGHWRFEKYWRESRAKRVAEGKE